jgi:hypothetical protein
MSTIVSLPYDPVWKALEWAKAHCPSYITNDVHHDDSFIITELKGEYFIDYFFGKEEEAVLFTLRWK